jgi:hypothetical protein
MSRSVITPWKVAVLWVPLLGLVGALTIFAQQVGQDVPCAVTSPNGIVASEATRHADGENRSFGNTLLSVAWLEPDGTIIFKPGGAGFVTPSGGLGMKFGWTKVAGTLVVTGRRRDGDAPPLRFSTNSPNHGAGFEASYLIFGGPGCWEVNAKLAERDDSKLMFVTKVVKIGDGPVHLRSEPE